MSPSDVGFPMYATRINVLDALRGFGLSQNKHVDMRHIHRRKTLPMLHSTLNAKICQIFAVKIGHPYCRTLMSKACENSFLRAMMHLR